MCKKLDLFKFKSAELINIYINIVGKANISTKLLKKKTTKLKKWEIIRIKEVYERLWEVYPDKPEITNIWKFALKEEVY